MTTIYRYGALAWFWRALILLGIGGGAALIGFAVHFRSAAFVAAALPLLFPALFCGWVVATSVRLDGDRIHVGTLLMIRRTLPLSALGRPRVRLLATAVTTQIDAPRAWVPVQRRLPVYLDLFAGIPDRRAFLRVFPLSPAVASVLDD